MIPVSAVVFLLAIGSAQAPAKQPERPASQAGVAAKEIARLDLVLSLAQEARQEGRLTSERYDEFLKRFRVEFDDARVATPSSPPATALVARILARLGESQQAEAVLGPALEANPDDPGLRVALGHVRFEAGDYPASLAQAEAVLKLDPADKQAQALKLYSVGRSKGAASDGALLPAAGLEEASILNDPRIVMAARGALARKSAIGYADEAMRRLKIEDPHAALRYLAMGEAVDPGYADIPMQQGLAHRQLREHAAAVERFARAETLWRAQGTPRADEAADMARKLREEQAKASAAAVVPARDGSQSQKREMPLWPVGAALIAVGLGAAVIIEKRRSEEQARRLIEVAGPAGIALIGAGLIAASLAPPAGLVMGSGGAAALAEASALGRAAVGIYGANELVRTYASYAKSNPPADASQSPNLNIGAKKLPSMPEGVDPPGFGKILQWGTGDAAARLRMQTMTREELRRSGVTREMAEEWRDFYLAEKARIPQNPSAAGRADLMARAVELLKD